ncbi:MAG: hypothetical protein WD844_02075 [Thermoleophilaceae bacterium]
MLLIAGCGDDEESGDPDVATAPVVTTDRVQTAEIPGTDSDEATSPEDQPGGAGDEEPARSEVVIDFSEEGLSPTEVQVAPFIAVVLVIRSTDGTEYNLSYTAPAEGGGANGTTEADFDIDGLRPGQKIEIEERNTDSTATVVASDEAGP